MSDLVDGRRGRTSARYPAIDDEGGGRAAGRHAFDEDAVLTPIFHALQRGGWRSRQHEVPPRSASAHRANADPVDEFRRDPLTAPIPVQALVPVPSAPSPRRVAGAHAVTEGRPEAIDHGRHHRRRERLSANAGS